MERTVLPIHFEDRSGTEFERLVFAYVLNSRQWDSLKWLGQTGDDGGRDIWGEFKGETYCYQCANYRQLTLQKVTEDIDKLIKGKTVPNTFVVVCGGRISTDLRTKIENQGKVSGIQKLESWTGVEFEEKLSKETPELLKRFVEGEVFPDSPSELLRYVRSFSINNDKDIVDLIVECFDRPAFTTRFQHESSMPNFEKAITDTIEVLNTGVHRLRDGTVIRTIPSRHRITDNELKNKLAELTNKVIGLRDNFVALKKSSDIRPCGCGDVNCPVYMLSEKACKEMDSLRELIFFKLREIKQDMGIRFHN